MSGPLAANDAMRFSDLAIALIGTDVTMSLRGAITGFDIGNNRGRAKNTVGNMPRYSSNARASPSPSQFRAIFAR